MNTAPLLLLLALCASGVGAVTPSATIELRPQVSVSTRAVSLGQVAVLTSGNLALLRRLVDLPLGLAPAADHQVQLHREQLQDWVASRLRMDTAQLRWQGQASTHVTSAATSVRGEEVSRIAESSLRQWLAQRYEDGLQVAADRTPLDARVPAGQVQLQARSLREAPLRERMVVWVDIRSDGRFVKAIPVAFSVSGLGPMAFPLRATAAAPVQATRRVSPKRDDTVAVQRNPDVARGQWASLRTSSGEVTLEARVEVLQDGLQGQNVRVRPAKATQPLMARVIGPGQLEVLR